MRKLALAGIAAAAAAMVMGGAVPRRRRRTPLTLQLKWVTQAQFAGYYVAEAKGFYQEAGLDVTIKPGGPDINPSAGDRRRRRRRGGRLDAVGAGDPREGRAAGQHRPDLQQARA